jgi:hypothetical protein
MALQMLNNICITLPNFTTAEVRSTLKRRGVTLYIFTFYIINLSLSHSLA